MILKIIFKPMYFLKFVWNNISSYFRLQFYRNSGIKIGKKVFVSPKAFIDRSKSNMITIGENNSKEALKSKRLERFKTIRIIATTITPKAAKFNIVSRSGILS